MKIGFLGFGTMGRAMAPHLAAKGMDVWVYNRSAISDVALHASRCRRAASPLEAAKDATAVLSCVADDRASAMVWQGPQGALDGISELAWAIELSTLSPAYVDQWGTAVRRAGARPLDCPLTGSKRGAESATLVGFLGAEQPAREVEEILRSFCSDLVPFGAFGNGMKFKLVYNMIGASIGAILGESLSLLSALRIPEASYGAVLRSESWAAAAYNSKSELLDNRTYEPVNFKTSLMVKDLQCLGSELARLGLSSAFLPLVESAYHRAMELGYAAADFIAVREAFGPLLSERDS